MTQPLTLKKDGLYVAVIALAVMAWFHPFFLRGEILIPPNINSAYPWHQTEFYRPPHPQGSMDAVRENYITWAIHDDYLQQGYAPHWQPYFLSGNPLLANQFSIPYSPYKLLNIPFSAGVAWSWAMILKCFFNGLFTYLSLRLLGRSYPAATIGALAWMLSWPLAHQTQTTYNEGVAWMSGVFFFFLLSLQALTSRRAALYALPAALIAGFQFLAGNIQMTIYSAMFLGGFALIWPTVGAHSSAPLPLQRLRPLYTLIAIYALGVVIGAAQWMSSYELLGLSIRGVSQTHANKGIEPYTAVSFLNPWIYFWQNFEFPELREKYWLNYRWNPYIGLIPFFVQGIVLFWVKDKLARRILYVTLAVFAVLQVVYWRPIFELVSQLPAYDALDQTRLLIVLSFPLAILSAYGIDWLLEQGQAQRRKVWLLLGMATVVLALATAGMLLLTQYFNDELRSASRLGDSFTDQRIAIGTQVIADYYRLENPLFAATLAFGIAGIALIAAYSLGWIKRPIMEWALIGLCAVDLVLMAGVNVGSTPREDVYPVTESIAFLQDKMESEGPFRIGASANTLYQGRPTGDYADYQDDHGWFMSSMLPVLTPNTAALYGLQDVRGYESVYTLHYSQYMAAMNGQAEPFSALVIPETYRHPMLDALNMRYILSIEPLPDPDLIPVYEGEMWIYENPDALGRFQFYDSYQVLENDDAVLAALADADFDPHTDLYFSETDSPPSPQAGGEVALRSQQATLTYYDPNRITLHTQTDTDSILVLSEIVYPGWQAYLDGQPIPTARANYLFRAVQVPAGEHTLEFRYESAVINWGERLSIAGVILLGIIAFFLDRPTYFYFYRRNRLRFSRFTRPLFYTGWRLIPILLSIASLLLMGACLLLMWVFTVAFIPAALLLGGGNEDWRNACIVALSLGIQPLFLWIIYQHRQEVYQLPRIVFNLLLDLLRHLFQTLIAIPLSAQANYPALDPHQRLVEGELTAFHKTWFGDPYSLWFLMPVVTLEVAFVSPASQQPLAKRYTQPRYDLFFAKPKQGTKVLIAYATDDDFHLL